MSELSIAVAKARAARMGDFLATPQALIEERAKHEKELTELRNQWEAEKQVYEERLQSLVADIAVQRAIVEKLAAERENSLALKKLPPKFELIRYMVCEHFKVPMVDFCSVRHTQPSARARQVAYWLARNLTTLSTTQLGRICGGSGRDHSTVVHGIKKINKLMAADPAYAAEILVLKEKVEMACNDNPETAGTTERQSDAQG